jgi:hypothetical protein
MRLVDQVKELKTIIQNNTATTARCIAMLDKEVSLSKENNKTSEDRNA